MQVDQTKPAKQTEAKSQLPNKAFQAQFVASQNLLERVLKISQDSLGTLLEIGRNSVFLGDRLTGRAESCFFADSSASRLQNSLSQVQDNSSTSLVFECDYPCFSAAFDTIILHSTLHRVKDPKLALSRLIACLKPGGSLYLVAIGNNSLHEWRTCHSTLGIPCGTLDFVSFGQLKNWLPSSGMRYIEEEWSTVTYKNALDFLKCLKENEEHVPHLAHTPLPYRTFKEVMSTFDKEPRVSYQLLYGYYRKPLQGYEE